jgi:hypothetical protein
MVDHRHPPAQSQPQAEQADEEGGCDEDDGIGSLTGAQAAPGDRHQPTKIEAHACQAGGWWRGDEVANAFDRNPIHNLVTAPMAIVAGCIGLWYAPPRIVRQAGAHGHLPPMPPCQPSAHPGVVVGDAGRFRPVVVGIDGEAHVGTSAHGWRLTKPWTMVKEMMRRSSSSDQLRM